ncbi:MAG: hypothetical protein JWM64_298, partial [Frankiales bacterium]|nr:hypothetical protein [Frankiales bacterium]
MPKPSAPRRTPDRSTASALDRAVDRDAAARAAEHAA